MMIQVDFEKDGLLWLINKSVLHPRGYALGHIPDTNEFVLLGDGSEPWRFATPAENPEAVDENQKFLAVESLLERAKQENIAP